jgi:pimeloyl-ACP methyl ester carboxylesterase
MNPQGLGRRVWGLCVRALVVAGMSFGVTIPAPLASAGPSVPTADATLGPLVSATSSYVNGVYVWTDYAYDDRGPDSNGQLGGDAQYAEGVDPNNVADLIQLQVARSDATTLELVAVLETLTPTTNPVLGVGLDLDSDTATGAPSLPGSWETNTPLGIDRLITLTTQGGQVSRVTDAGWEVTDEIQVETDPQRNTLTGSVPLSLPDRGTVRAVAALGYEHNGESWLTGDLPVHDLAFVDDGWTSTQYLAGVVRDASGFVTGGSAYWQDGVQSTILAGNRSARDAVAQIDLRSLARGRTDLASPGKHGFSTYLYRSNLDLGEGIQGSGNSALYAGPYQPYLVWLPEELEPGLPLVVYLHGSSQTHMSTVNTSHYDPGSVDPVINEPDHIFDFDAVVAWPLGRGPQQGYDAAGEQDALDVTDDALARLQLDRDRVMLAGLSMGGMGTFRLGQLYPDRWALAYADVGADQTGLAANMTNLPLRFQNGVADPLVNPALSLATRQAIDAAGTVDYRSWLLMAGRHGPQVRLAECVYLEAFATRRVVDPARVRYTTDPAMFVDDPPTGLRLIYDGAYWVSGMEPASEAPGSVDLTSEALGEKLVPGATSITAHDNVVSGRDFCGANPDSSTRDSWNEQSRDVAIEPAPVNPLIRGTFTGLSAVTIDAARARLAAHDLATLKLDTDGPVALRLTGLRNGTVVTSGEQLARAANGAAEILLPAGAAEVTLSR